MYNVQFVQFVKLLKFFELQVFTEEDGKRPSTSHLWHPSPYICRMTSEPRRKTSDPRRFSEISLLSRIDFYIISIFITSNINSMFICMNKVFYKRFLILDVQTCANNFFFFITLLNIFSILNMKYTLRKRNNKNNHLI